MLSALPRRRRCCRCRILDSLAVLLAASCARGRCFGDRLAALALLSAPASCRSCLDGY